LPFFVNLSQDLLCDFYQAFSQSYPDLVIVFEKILFLVIDDVHQKEVQRLEATKKK
jgi:hypothetical protein